MNRKSESVSRQSTNAAEPRYPVTTSPRAPSTGAAGRAAFNTTVRTSNITMRLRNPSPDGISCSRPTCSQPLDSRPWRLLRLFLSTLSTAYTRGHENVDPWLNVIATGSELSADSKELDDVGFVVIPGPVAPAQLSRLGAVY